MIDHARRSQITIAAVIILYGAVFLLHTVGVLGDRWWAMIVSATAVYFLLDAWLRYRMHGRLAPSVTIMALVGLNLLLAGVVMYEQWTWAVMWPMSFILVGAILLLMPRRTT